MRESIHKYFQVGLIGFMAYPGNAGGDDPNIVQTIRKIACDDYFDAIEVNWIKDPARRAEAARVLETAHMTVCYGAQPALLTTGLNPNATDEAEALGAGGIAFLAGKWRPETKEEAYAQLLKTTRALCDHAAGKDMMVELEVFDFDVAKASLIGPAPLAARFAADMRTTHNNFGLLIDLSHIPMCRESSEFVVRTLRPYLAHFHIGNTVCTDPAAEGYGDEHQRFASRAAATTPGRCWISCGCCGTRVS